MAMSALRSAVYALFAIPGMVLAQAWTYTPPAFPDVCTNPAVVGEWTMDYETASQLAQAEGRALYLLVTGSTWCPDCDGLQRQVMATPEMADFMRASDAYWVWLDFPSRRATNAVDYGWLCHTNTGLFTLEESEAILARNRELEFAYGSIKGYRTFGTINMPTFVVCHPDGAYQGEVTHYRQWTNVTAEVFIDQIIRIWNDDAWDVQDNRIPVKSDDAANSATPLADIGEAVLTQPHTLSPTDEADWYTFTALPGRTYRFGAEGRILTGQAALPEGQVTVEIFTDTNAAAVASVTGALTEAQAVEWMLDQALPVKGYVKVSGAFEEVAGYTFAYNRTAAVTPTARVITKAEGAVVDGLDSMRVVGVLTLSVNRNGRITAKYLGARRTVHFLGKDFWTTFDANGILTTVLSRGDYRLEIQMPGAGELYAVMTDPDYANPLSVNLLESPWSAANRATAYEGYYTVVFSPEQAEGARAPRGHTYMTVLLSPYAVNSGRVTYAGKLADGSGFSGRSVLYPLPDGSAQMTVFVRTGKNIFSGLLSIEADAASAQEIGNASVFAACGCVRPHWRRATGQAETSFDVPLSVAGVYYSSANNLLDYYALFAGEGPLHLMAAGEALVSEAYGTAAAVPFVALEVTESSMRIPFRAENPTRANLFFNKRTGIFRGAFTIPFAAEGGASRRVAARYAGVLLPGWVTEEGCDLGCGDVLPEEPTRPFGMGAYQFRDRIMVNGRTQSFVASRPMLIALADEE